MNDLAASIRRNPEKMTEFLVMDRLKASEWLKNSDRCGEETGSLFHRFISRHGHRCIREVSHAFFWF